MVGFVLMASAASGCSSGPPPNPYPSCTNGHYILDDPTVTPGGFDSAACVAFMKAIPNVQTDGTKAPEFITPLAGALLPATPIATFTWTPGQLAAGDGGATADGGADAAAGVDEGRRGRKVARNSRHLVGLSRDPASACDVRTIWREIRAAQGGPAP